MPLNEKTRGVIALGRAAALASGLVEEADFKVAGAKGMVVRARSGRIALAAKSDENIETALDGFLFVIRSRHGGVAADRKLPKSSVPIIRALTLIDWPPFGPVFEKKGPE